MRLAEVALTNFRGYRERVSILIDDLTVLIGRNDAGKSSVLEALDIVLGDGKVEAADICVHCSAGDVLSIECAFDEPGAVIVLDSMSKTTLAGERLLDPEGRLRIRWSWSISSDDNGLKLSTKHKTYLVAVHPTAERVNDLHATNNAGLKQLVRAAGLEDEADQNNNSSMRAALWEHAAANDGLQMETRELELTKESGKEILSQVEKLLPRYVLFKADRPSTDQDAEVQDPMKAAIRQAVDEVESELEAIKEKVTERALEVANRTLASLREIDPALAASLQPRFAAEPKWDSLFKVALYDEAGIPMNKRGSGARRLVLISFFRAESELRRERETGRAIIYAVEEPETAQHPDNQRRLIEALKELARQDGCQVLLTTHVPGLAELVPVESLRHVRQDTAGCSVEGGDDEAVLEVIADSLGVLPRRTVKVLICVEGPTDVDMLVRLARLWRTEDPTVPELDTDPHIAVIPLGGKLLKGWVERRYLQRIRVPEFHLYDRDPVINGVPEYQAAVDAVNARGGGHSARLTNKREIENYAHPSAVNRVLSRATGQEVAISFGHHDDVVTVLSESFRDDKGQPRRKLNRRDWKHWLTTDIVDEMTLEELKEIDPAGEVKRWLDGIRRLARDEEAEVVGAIASPQSDSGT